MAAKNYYHLHSIIDRVKRQGRMISVSTCKTYHKPLSICKVYQGRILVRAPFELKDKLKEIPTARWLPAYKCWSYSPTPAIALKLDTMLGTYAGTYQADEEFQSLLQQSFKQAEAQAAKDAEDLPPIPCTKTPAWRHQLQAFWFVANLWGGLPS